MGIKAEVTYSSNNDKITFLYPDGNVLEVMKKSDFYGHDAAYVDGFNGLMLRSNKSDHAQEYWNYISGKFKESDVWYE